MRFHSSGRPRHLRLQHFVAIYDPTDGRIIHLHTVHVLEGGKDITRAQAEEEAVAKAKEIGHDVGNYQIHYASKLPEGGGRYRFDLTSRTLVALERPVKGNTRRGRK